MELSDIGLGVLTGLIWHRIEIRGGDSIICWTYEMKPPYALAIFLNAKECTWTENAADTWAHWLGNTALDSH
jgi:hypothetical protein